jgi:DNA-binding response OmpR family regulator
LREKNPVDVSSNNGTGSSLILIVNDEPALRDFFKFNLRGRGFKVIDISGSQDVINVVRKEMPDLTILDLMVREVDGFELCRSICATSSSRMIAFNMRGGEADLLRCLEIGVDDYLGKPFGVQELMSRVRAVLDNKREVKTSAAKAMAALKPNSWREN